MGWEADRARDAAESMSWAEQQAALEEADAYERDRWGNDENTDYDDGNGMTVGRVALDPGSPTTGVFMHPDTLAGRRASYNTRTGRFVVEGPPPSFAVRGTRTGRFVSDDVPPWPQHIVDDFKKLAGYSQADAEYSLKAFARAFGNINSKGSTTSMSSKKRALELQLKAIAEALAKLEARPKEPKRPIFVEGDELAPTILFSKSFGTSRGEYSYSAVGINGRWYTTGPRSPKAYSWDELMDWLESTGPMPKLYLVQKSGVKLYWAPDTEDESTEGDEE
jgi:hypothetical protein